MKVSKNMLTLLRKVNERGKLYVAFKGCYLLDPPTQVHKSTARALFARDLIEWHDGDPSYYVISPAGRSALAAAEGAE